MNTSLKVLYVDDSQKDIELYGAIWQKLLEAHGFDDVDFRHSLKFDLEIIEKQLPHLVVADNVLVSEDGRDEFDNEGAQFIADLKSRYDHIVCVLFTHATFSIKTLGQLTPNPDLLIPKTHFRSPEYRDDWVAPKIRKLLARRPVGNIIFDTPILQNEYKDLFPTILCILEQCLNEVSSFEAGLAAQIKMSKLTGGASGASVFLVDVSGVERFQNVPLVFRISDSTYVREEVQNYKRFVSLQVPHDLRVELVGFGEHLDFGGALYAFALADVMHTTTALSLLKAQNTDQTQTLSGILKRVFSRENLGWYNNDGNGVANLVEYFSRREEYNQRKDHRRIRGISRNLKKFELVQCSIDGDFLSFEGVRLRLPRNIMEMLGGLEVEYAVVHGDMNLNNLIVSEKDQRVALIDFEYCGVDHIFKDFVSLEVSALELYDGFSDFDEALNFFRMRHSAKHFWDERSDMVGAIRTECRSAYGELREGSEMSYLLCLSFHLFKVAALEDVEKVHFLAMYASLCASLERLNQEADQNTAN